MPPATATTTVPAPSTPAPPELTPVLVRAVTEKVYQLWLRDWQLARERRGQRGDQHKFSNERK